MQKCYCKGIIVIVGGILFLLDSLQIIQIGITPYLPIMFILVGIFYMTPRVCGNEEYKK
ncbi:hypothetical protein J7J83_03130 [bacterium]|nr:hypothetical protein [bacterium]